MRKVLVSVRHPKSGLFTADKREAWFHQFSTDYEELNQGVGVFAVAIVEYPDGKLDSIPIHLVQFAKPLGE